MKRSDIVMLIRDQLVRHFLQCSEVTRDHCYWSADYILQMIEEEGMLPPTLDDKSFQILGNGEMTFQVNEWEPEDE